MFIPEIHVRHLHQVAAQIIIGMVLLAYAVPSDTIRLIAHNLLQVVGVTTIGIVLLVRVNTIPRALQRVIPLPMVADLTIIGILIPAPAVQKIPVIHRRRVADRITTGTVIPVRANIKKRYQPVLRWQQVVTHPHRVVQ